MKTLPRIFPLRSVTVASILAVALAATVEVRASAAERRANVLLIVADDLRAELGCYGSMHAKTPNLDALASRGVRFTRAYTQQAVCNPSRASFLTGLRNDRVGVWDLSARFRETNPSAVTLPEHFKKQGYHTEGIGKIFHNETRRPPAGRPPMADPESWSAPPLYATGAHWEDWVVPGDPFGPKEKGDAWQCLDVPDENYFDGKIAAAASQAIDRLAEGEQPFFLAVGFWKPHLPFNAPKKYWDLYAEDNFGDLGPRVPPAGAPEIALHDSKELRSYGGVSKDGPISDREALMLRRGYLACISFLDAQVGRVLEALRRSGAEDNTIVVFVSDHGFHLGEHDLWAKTSNYELDARVPLIFAGPGIRQHGASAAGLVELVDLYPTVVQLAGVPAGRGLDGVSLVPQIDNPSRPGKQVAVTQHPHPFYGGKWTAMGYAMRTDRYRYVEWRDRGTGEIVARELYDQQTDPGETRNLVDDTEHRDVVRSLAHLATENYRFVPRPAAEPKSGGSQ